MVNRLIRILLGVFTGAVFALQGCAPISSETATSGGSAEPLTRTAMVSSGSSLEALRRGEAAAEGLLKNIYFDFDRHELQTDARETLKGNAAWLNGDPSIQLEIEGHCDERGTTEYNLALGAKRAQAAKDYLVSLGISADRISTVSYGKEVPVCREKSEECWQKSRHDRFVVMSARPAT